MNQQHLQELVTVVREESEKGETSLYELLKSILTPSELEQMVKRLQIIKQLKQGRTHRDIAEDLGVGVATIARGVRELEQGNFEYV
jgi:TrpR family trp operon transcriptional repressor